METESKTSVKQLSTIITASSVGTLIEWYDFYIFGSLATIISSHFFPKGNPTASFLATLATFAAGLVVRPFGSLFFGRIGDLVGRKYTFLVTIVIMGGSTFAIGLVPSYNQIGFWAPVIILLLRLLQGLAIGGEYGGAATFVAEHAPPSNRGFWTSWIQITAISGFILSIIVIMVTKMSLSQTAWESWGWRIPFLVSVVLLWISVWIRKNMKESPLFAKAKAEGKTSSHPLRDSFGNRANLKLVLLALFGITMGVAAGGWATVLYAQTFMLKTMHLDFDQANKVVMIGLFLGSGTLIFFGWLSDRIGSKPLLLLSLLVAVIFLRPIFGEMYKTTDTKVKLEDPSGFAIEKTSEPAPTPDALSRTTTKKRHLYTDGTVSVEIKKETYKNGIPDSTETSESILVSSAGFRKLIVLVFLLGVINSLAYGPLAAFLVELFPLKIRYTSLSLPYHIAYGIFGGMSQVISTYLIGKARDAGHDSYYLAGLTYTIVIMAISFVIGLFYINEKKKSVPGQRTFLFWNKLKQWLGVVWMLMGLAAAYFGIFKLGIPKITSGNQEDLIFGIIVMIIITPIASAGLIAFGKYAWDGEYNS